MNYENLIPSELINELITIRDSVTKDNFRIGDIVGIVIKVCDARGLQVLREDIYKAVGCYVGKAARSVREYYMVAQIYPESLRKQFEILSFDHFRNAAQLGGENDIKALRWAVKQTDQLGRPATVEAMLAKFASPCTYQDEIKAWDAASDEPLKNQEENIRVPEAVTAARAPYYRMFINFSNSIVNLINNGKLAVKPETAAMLKQALRKVEEEISKN